MLQPCDGAISGLRDRAVQNPRGHIWIVDVATGVAHKLNSHESYLDEVPSWLPDGKRIAFQSNRSGTMEVWVMNADGSAPRQITK